MEEKLSEQSIWSQPEKLKELNKKKTALERVLDSWEGLSQLCQDLDVFYELAEEGDEEAEKVLPAEVQKLQAGIRDLETKSLLGDPWDVASCYISINAGAGGTESCDWALMLHRMFVRFAQRSQFKTENISFHEGEEAGIKSATLSVEGPFAFGLLKAEVGVHRLVRISPFDSNSRRHTSFASVFVWPEVEDEDEDAIEIPPDQIRVDTYRASGAGGQHINTTDSAVRITHLPTGLVVQCQNQRSQHQNRERALRMLRSALADLEKEKKEKQLENITAEKRINEWGSQIRSYVLHPYKMVKDHRTLVETSQPDMVLDGDLSGFIHEYLRQRVAGQWKGKT